MKDDEAGTFRPKGIRQLALSAGPGKKMEGL
jgi:hypothetical protein